MTTTITTITVRVSKEDAVRFGVPEGTHAVPITEQELLLLTPEERQALISRDVWYHLPPTAEALIAAAKAEAEQDRVRAEQARRAAEAEQARRAAYEAEHAPKCRARIAQILADPTIMDVQSYWYYDGEHQVPLSCIAEWQAMLEVIASRRRERQALEEATKLAKEQAKRDYLAAWLVEHGEPDLLEQAEAGLLSRKELVSACAAWTLRHLPPAVELSFCRDESCPCGRESIATVPRRLWPAVKALLTHVRQHYPDATVTFEDVTICQRESQRPPEQWPQITVAVVSVPAGPFTFVRRIAIGEEA